jgi:hypothetical protein
MVDLSLIAFSTRPATFRQRVATGSLGSRRWSIYACWGLRLRRARHARASTKLQRSEYCWPEVGRAILPAAAFPGGFRVGRPPSKRRLESRRRPGLAAPHSIQRVRQFLQPGTSAHRSVAFRTGRRRRLPGLPFSELNTQPTYAPVQRASSAASFAWLGVRMVAIPFLCDSCIHYSTPVYPHAIPAASLLHFNQRLQQAQWDRYSGSAPRRRGL